MARSITAIICSRSLSAEPKGAHATSTAPTTLTASLLLTLQYIGYVCAVWPLAFGRRLGARAPLGRLAVACGGLSVVALTLVPLTGGFADVPWPRYLLLALPGLALSVAEVSRNRYVAGLVAGVVILAAGWVLTSANRLHPGARADVGQLAEKIHTRVRYRLHPQHGAGLRP